MSQNETRQQQTRSNVREDMEISIQEIISILWRRAWIIVLAAFVGLGGGVALNHFTAPTYEAEVELLIEGEQPQMGGSLTMLGGLDGGGGRESLSNRLRIIRSPVVLEPANSLLLAQGYTKGTVRDLEKNLTASAVQNTDVIRLTVQAATAQEAKQSAEAVVSAYKQYSKEQAQEESIRMEQFLAEQVQQAEGRVEDAERAIRDFQHEVGIMYLGSEEQKVNKHLATLEGRLMNAEISLKESELRLDVNQQELEQIRQELPKTTTVGPEQLIGELEKLLAELKATRAEYLSRGLDGSPEIARVEQRIDNITGQIQEELTDVAQSTSDPRGNFAVYRELVLEQMQLLAEIDGYSTQIGLLQERIGDKQEELMALSDKAFAYAKLERDVEVSKNTYQMVVEELERTRIAVERETADVRVIRPPQAPEAPISPRRALNMAIGMTLAIMVSVGSIMAAEMLDNSVKSRSQLEDLGIPLLGMVPKVKEGEKGPNGLLMDGTDATNPVAAAYVRVESNLRLASFETEPQVFVSTSAVPNEGKSTTSLNFSYTLAQSGQRVLLVDGDLRRPQLHRILREDRSPGLSEVVAGQIDFEDAVRPVIWDDVQVDVLTAGLRPPSIINVFRSQAFAELLKAGRGEYDWVIVDLPPILVGSEALEVAAHSDGALLVIESNKTSVQVLEEAVVQLEQADVKVLGAILNQHSAKDTGYGYKYEEHYSDDGR